MPELPEIVARARQIKAELVGKTITNAEVLQPKCLNLPPETFIAAVTGARILDVTHHGKWLYVNTDRGWMLINLGMGGELRLVTRDTLPEKRRLILDFSDGTCLAVNFWWFGYVHYVASDGLASHAMTCKIGPNALEVTTDDLRRLVRGRRTAIKALLLDQERIAGIGNAYIHDILFLAHLHPLRPANSLLDAEVDALARSIGDGLRPSVDKGGAFYETDLHGQPGGFTLDDILVGYKEGKPCPACGTTIAKIKTGSTSSFICPNCQPLPATS